MKQGSKRTLVALALAIALALLATPATAVAVAATTSFTDVPNSHWAADFIGRAQNYGLMTGTGSNQFNPDGTLSQAQCAQIVYNAVAQTHTQGGQYWYSPAVNYVENATGLTLSPEAVAPRWWICLVLYRLDANNPKARVANGDIFDDCRQLPSETQIAILWAQSNGIASGYTDGGFYPEDTLSRAQAAKVFSVWYENLHWQTQLVTAEEAAQELANYANAAKLVAEVSYHNISDGYTWYALRVHAKNGSYHFVTTGEVWYAWTGSEYRITSAEELRTWISQQGAALTDAEKLQLAAKWLSDYAEELGLTVQYDTGTEVRIARPVTVSGVAIDAQIGSAYLVYDSITVSTTATGLSVLCNGTASSIQEARAYLDTLASSLSYQTKVLTAALHVSNVASSYRWTTEISSWPNENGTYWLGLKASSNNGGYQFVVGGNASGNLIQWYRLRDGVLTEVSRAYAEGCFQKYAA